MASEFADGPDRVGRYEILLPIAKGGMATVYLARAEGHGGFDRYVALKLTLPHLRHDPELAAHLLDEAKLVAHIRHTNVVPMLDVGQDENGVFLVMEYVAGDSLSGLNRHAAASDTLLPKAVGLRILLDALEGLHAAHEHRDEDGHPLYLVHRDFSPQNILVGTDGVARLADFGIAKAASRVSNTAVGHIKGKMSYVAPEQARGAPLDRRCDLWAAGVIAWEIMCGRKLNTPNDQRAIVAMQKEEPPRIRTVVPDAPQALDDLIASVLQLEPDYRPATAAIFARELTKAAGDCGLVAQTHEVAAHVERLVGPMLAERKVRLAAARRKRKSPQPEPGAERPSSKGLVTVAMGSVNVAPREPSPAAEPHFDIDTDDSEDESSVRTLAVPSEAPPDLGSLGLLPEVTGAAEAEEAIAIPGLRESGAGRDVVTFGGLTLSRRAATIGAGAGALGIVGLVLIVIGITRSGGESANAAADANASGAATASAGVGAGTSRADASSDDPAEIAQVQFIALKANVAIADVRIGERFVDMVVPAPNVNVELTPEETGHAASSAAAAAVAQRHGRATYAGAPLNVAVDALSS